MSWERPVGGVDYPRTYQEFREWFPDEPSCRTYLAELRWPLGFTCPRCDGSEFWGTGRGLRMCPACGLKTSVTAGTIFHRSHTPLSTWFAAIWLVTSQKNGVSAQGLQDALGFGSYETAWAWLHKLRRAMVRPDRDLIGDPSAGIIVELDQSFLGGKSAGKTGGSSDKVPITIAVERTTKGRLGRVRMEVAEKKGGLDMIDFATDVITPGTTVHTDGAQMFNRLPDLGYGHEASPSSKGGHLVEDIDAVMPGPHLVSSLLKRWTAGTLHYRLSLAHLPYYLDEFTFRFNRRNSRARGILFYRLLQQAVDTDPHPLKELIGGG
ncbi:MAG: IS1595 family transposase [Rhodoglobus sp.]|nr:IS1595 family transposase [Rhodoglobus sp.]